MDEMLRSALEGRTAAYGLLARLLNREVDEELLAELRALPFAADEAVPSRILRTFPTAS